MEEMKPSAGQSALFYGLILSAGVILLHLILFLFDASIFKPGFLLLLLILAVGISFVSYDYRNKKWGGYITYGKAVKIGFLSVLFSSVLIAIYNWMFYTYIDDALVVKVQDFLITAIKDFEMDTEEKAEALVAIPKYYNAVSGAIATVFLFAFWGIIISLITSTFIKKEKQLSLG